MINTKRIKNFGRGSAPLLLIIGVLHLGSLSGLSQEACRSDTDLNSSDASEAEFSAAKDCWTRRAKGGNKDLRDAYLGGAVLIGADLSNVDFTGAYLKEAFFQGANFSNSILIDSSMEGINLTDAILTGADLTGADLFYEDIPPTVTSAVASRSTTKGFTQRDWEEWKRKGGTIVN